MAWEWGTNEYFCLPYVTILWCPSWELPNDRGKKWNSYPWPQTSYLDFEILVFIFPKLDYHQWLKVHTFAIWEIQTSRRMQHVGIIKTVCCSKKKLSRDLCSPGSRQLLQLQHFPNFLKILGTSFYFYLAWDCLVSWNLSFLCYKFWSFEVRSRLKCFFLHFEIWMI